jgi:putative endonuclease
MHKLIYLYILECADKSYYTGVTNNLELRIEQHKEGINPSSYTYNKRPVKLLWYEMFNDFDLAFQKETQIKKWSRAKKEALISGDFTKLIPLSKKKFNRK